MNGFLDEMVRGRAPAEPAAPARVFLMGANEWLDLAAWPPPGEHRAQPCTWTATAGANSRFGDGRLIDGPATGRLTGRRVDPRSRAGRCRSSPPASSAQIGGPDDYAGSRDAR